MRIITAAQTTFWPIAWLGLLSTLSLSLTGFIALHANCSKQQQAAAAVCAAFPLVIPVLLMPPPASERARQSVTSASWHRCHNQSRQQTDRLADRQTSRLTDRQIDSRLYNLLAPPCCPWSSADWLAGQPLNADFM